MVKKFIIYTAMMMLLVGVASPAYAQHCDVRKGDSMWIIAKRYHVDFKKLLELNKHFKDKDLIYPKDEIELPDGSTGNGTNQGSDKDNIEEGSDNVEEEKETTVQAKQILSLVNQERSKQGLKSLKLSNKLSAIATEKARDMKDNRYFSHNSPTYGSPFQMLQKFGVTYKTAGENIASGQKTAQQVMNDWMNSSGHRANILNSKYTELGVGYVKDGNYWVQIFIGN